MFDNTQNQFSSSLYVYRYKSPYGVSPFFLPPSFFFLVETWQFFFLVNRNLKKAHAQSAMYSHSYFAISTQSIKCNFKVLALARTWYSKAGMLPKYGCGYIIILSTKHLTYQKYTNNAQQKHIPSRLSQDC